MIYHLIKPRDLLNAVFTKSKIIIEMVMVRHQKKKKKKTL